MKRISLAIVFGIVCLLSATLSAKADTTVFGSLTTVATNTVNSSVIQTNTANVNVGRFIVSNGGTTSTNAFSGVRQFSLDGVNFVTVGGTYHPSSTNAGTETIAATTLSIPIYMRMSATTTNSVGIGAVYISP